MQLDIQLDIIKKHSALASKTVLSEVESGPEASNDDFEEEVDCAEHQCPCDP